MTTHDRKHNSRNYIPKISGEVIAAHGLKDEEYQQIVSLLKREPNMVELGIFSAMWNEHCSYKSSKKWLRTLPTTGKQVIQGPGENAGVIDIGDGLALVFKMESHNHPSFIAPYQGAATGVGGILRDVFTMGARPVACLNSLKFGSPDHPRTRHLVSGVVSGIGGYGNSFGVATIGGDVVFDQSYDQNILVNAFGAGIAKIDSLFYSRAPGAGLPVVYLGAKTGRDGVGGASMASAGFDDNSESKRPTVQIGDPFIQKCLLEACLELMAGGAVIAIQDMGAAGLTCSAVEMGAKGDLGIELYLDKVPVREHEMTACELMLSESQERMLLLLNPDKYDYAAAVFAKWDLAFALIGRTIEDKRFKVLYRDELVADLPIKELGDQAPEYDRPYIPQSAPPSLLLDHDAALSINLEEALITLVSCSDLCSRRWIFEQYDYLIQGNTIQLPGADAGVIRIGESNRGLAFSLDVTPRYCQADVFSGAMQAVAECWRNLTACGAMPLAITDNLNFGNPEDPEIMGQLVGAIKGIGLACRSLDFPVVSGNVSLYNETNGKSIIPTPTIGGVGLIANLDRRVGIAIKAGQVLVLIGGHGCHMGQTIFGREILKQTQGSPPPVCFKREKNHGDFVRSLIVGGLIEACHDLSDGGLIITLTEMALAGGSGFTIKTPEPWWISLFSEDQARYVIACKPDRLTEIANLAKNKSIEFDYLGRAGGHEIIVDGALELPLGVVRRAHEDWLPRYMGDSTEDISKKV